MSTRPYLGLAVEQNKQPTVAIGAQNVFDKSCGAFTGETCASQILDVGASWTLTGHSEEEPLSKNPMNSLLKKPSLPWTLVSKLFYVLVKP